MREIIADDIRKIGGYIPPNSNKGQRQAKISEQIAQHLNTFAAPFELDKYTNLAPFLGQVCVESDQFSTTVEYASGVAYEGRKELGNVKRGDGKKYRGRGLMQTTGRHNTTRFNAWAHKSLSSAIKSIPNFIEEPEHLAKFPYAFFSAVYYWDRGNPTGKSLNYFAQDGNDEMITLRINGGYNHLGERLQSTARAGLVLLDYGTSIPFIRQFQRDHGIEDDGIIGRVTRRTLLRALQRADAEAASKSARKNYSKKPPPKKSDWSFDRILEWIKSVIGGK